MQVGGLPAEVKSTVEQSSMCCRPAWQCKSSSRNHNVVNTTVHCLARFLACSHAVSMPRTEGPCNCAGERAAEAAERRG